MGCLSPPFSINVIIVVTLNNTQIFENATLTTNQQLPLRYVFKLCATCCKCLREREGVVTIKDPDKCSWGGVETIISRLGGTMFFNSPLHLLSFLNWSPLTSNSCGSSWKSREWVSVKSIVGSTNNLSTPLCIGWSVGEQWMKQGQYCKMCNGYIFNSNVIKLQRWLDLSTHATK